MTIVAGGVGREAWGVHAWSVRRGGVGRTAGRRERGPSPSKANEGQPQISCCQRVNNVSIRAYLCETNPMPGQRDVPGCGYMETTGRHMRSRRKQRTTSPSQPVPVRFEGFPPREPPAPPCGLYDHRLIPQRLPVGRMGARRPLVCRKRDFFDDWLREPFRRKSFLGIQLCIELQLMKASYGS